MKRCNENYQKIMCKWAFKKFLVFDLGEENSKLLTELEKESKEVARLTLVESEVQQLKVELDDVQAKLKSTALELGKTQARNKTMERHEQVSGGPTFQTHFCYHSCSNKRFITVAYKSEYRKLPLISPGL